MQHIPDIPEGMSDKKIQFEARACVCMHSISFVLSKIFDVCFIHSTHRKDMVCTGNDCNCCGELLASGLSYNMHVSVKFMVATASIQSPGYLCVATVMSLNSSNDDFREVVCSL